MSEKIKVLFEFELKQELEEKKIEKQKNAEGQEIEVLVPYKVEKIRKFAIRKPNSKIQSEGDLFFAVENSKFIKNGVLPYAKMNKSLEEADGPFSKEREAEMRKLREDYVKAYKEYQEILSNTESEKTQDVEDKKAQLMSLMTECEGKINSWESQIETTFANSAEGLARTRTWMWYVLQLSYEIVDGNFKPFFQGDTFDAKMENYQELEDSDGKDSDDFNKQVIGKFVKLIIFWHKSRSINNKVEQADFQRVFNL